MDAHMLAKRVVENRIALLASAPYQYFAPPFDIYECEYRKEYTRSRYDYFRYVITRVLVFVHTFDDSNDDVCPSDEIWFMTPEEFSDAQNPSEFDYEEDGFKRSDFRWKKVHEGTGYTDTNVSLPPQPEYRREQQIDASFAISNLINEMMGDKVQPIYVLLCYGADPADEDTTSDDLYHVCCAIDETNTLAPTSMRDFDWGLAKSKLGIGCLRYLFENMCAFFDHSGQIFYKLHLEHGRPPCRYSPEPEPAELYIKHIIRIR
jgi:hypothetical protein